MGKSHHMITKNKNYKNNKVTRLSPEKREYIRARREKGILDHNINRVPKEVQNLLFNLSVEALEILKTVDTKEDSKDLHRASVNEREAHFEEMLDGEVWWGDE